MLNTLSNSTFEVMWLYSLELQNNELRITMLTETSTNPTCSHKWSVVALIIHMLSISERLIICSFRLAKNKNKYINITEILIPYTSIAKKNTLKLLGILLDD